jgi:acetyltransferase
MSETGSRRKRASEILSHRRPALNAMFAPEAVAVIGATERPGSVGRALLENLKSYRGPVYPVNRKHHRVLGGLAFPKIGAIPDHAEV